MMEPITVVIPGTPQGKARARFNGAYGAYTPAKTKAYETSVSWLASMAMRGKEQLTGGLHLDMRAVMPIPKSWSKSKVQLAILGEIQPTGKPDYDNILKSVTDGMNKIVYADDASIVSATFKKVYGTEPFVVVTVKPFQQERS